MRKYAIIIALLAVMAGCNFGPAPEDDASPTPEPVISSSPESSEPSLTPSATLSPAPPVASATPTFTALPPSITPTPSDTPGPYEYTIAENDTLITIIQTYGYTDLGVIAEIVRMNDNVPNADSLPGSGAVILIPRQTATPTPENAQLTEVAQASLPPTVSVVLPVETTIMQHIVIEGDSIVGIAQQYSTTLEVLSQLNPEILFIACDFGVPSGGPDCNPLLQVGQAVNVPAPTPTPTLSPTPSGSETPTPTPTYAAPMVISPPQGGSALPVPVRLDWVSVGVLQENEFYLVQVRDTTSSTDYTQVTKNTSILLPETMIPGDGQTHTITWTVRIATPNEQGVYQPIGGAPSERTFQWQSR
jgi:hypothetical protein